MHASNTFGIEGAELERVVARVRDAKRILVITGAGISAESGIPTFRGKDGWWKSRNPEELATMGAFRADPRFVWEWYEYRRELVARAEPNRAHRALAWLESQGKNGFVITQNVDDLHERAGSRNVVHIHGSLWRVTCMREGKTFEDHRVPLPELPPRCGCGGLLRPAVVWFGETLPSVECQEIDRYLGQGKIDIVFVVGTYATFGYVGAWALRAKKDGALLVEVNPDRTVLTEQADVVLSGKAGQVLDAVRSRLENGNPGAAKRDSQSA